MLGFRDRLVSGLCSKVESQSHSLLIIHLISISLSIRSSISISSGHLVFYVVNLVFTVITFGIHSGPFASQSHVVI